MYEETAALVTRLEVVKRMYGTPLKLGVGTNAIESEAWKLGKERLHGPTGHRFVMSQRSCDEQKLTETDDEKQKEGSPTQCWREPKLVRKLIALRKTVVSSQLGKARSKLKEEMRYIMATQPRKVASQAWEEVRRARKTTWAQENPKHVAKVDHLQKKSKDCSKHNRCREMDNIWAMRCRSRRAEDNDMMQRPKGHLGSASTSSSRQVWSAPGTVANVATTVPGTGSLSQTTLAEAIQAAATKAAGQVKAASGAVSVTIPTAPEAAPHGPATLEAAALSDGKSCYMTSTTKAGLVRAVTGAVDPTTAPGTGTPAQQGVAAVMESSLTTATMAGNVVRAVTDAVAAILTTAPGTGTPHTTAMEAVSQVVQAECQAAATSTVGGGLHAVTSAVADVLTTAPATAAPNHTALEAAAWPGQVLTPAEAGPAEPVEGAVADVLPTAPETGPADPATAGTDRHNNNVDLQTNTLQTKGLAAATSVVGRVRAVTDAVAVTLTTAPGTGTPSLPALEAAARPGQAAANTGAGTPGSVNDAVAATLTTATETDPAEPATVEAAHHVHPHWSSQ